MIMPARTFLGFERNRPRSKRLAVAGLVRDGVAAARADLMRSGSPDLDEPVDGILGMSFLRGTRFVYDPGSGRIHWWHDPAPGVTLPLSYTASHLPVATLKVSAAAVPALVDLGRMGGVDLPWTLRPAEGNRRQPRVQD